MEEIRIELDSIKKWRNKHEFRPMNRASALGLEKVGDGHLIGPLCKLLIEAGHDPSTPASAWRGDMLCLYAKSLQDWAFPKKKPQPEQFRRKG